MSDFLTIDELINRCLELNKINNDNIKCLNIKSDKEKNELDKLCLIYFHSDEVKIHELPFNKDLSFLNAFCYSLISKYKLLNIKQQEDYLEKIFINQILRDLRKKNGINKYITPSCALNKSIITTGFKQKKLNDNHIKFLSIFFNINIFIIKENVNTALTNTQNNYITLLYTRNKTFNVFKHSIILFYDKKNELYYPLSINDNFIFIYDKDKIFKNYLDNNVVFIEQIKDNDEIIYETLSKKYDNDIENIEENKNNMLKDKEKNKSTDTISSTTTSITSLSQSSINNQQLKQSQIINQNITQEKELSNNDDKDNDDKDNDDKDNDDKDNNKENDENIKEIEENEDENEDDNKNTTSNSIEEIKQDNLNININDIKITSKTPDIIKTSNSPETEEITNTITTEQAIMNVLEPQRIPKYTKDFLEQKPVVELKKLLKENNIKQSIRVDGKVKQKTRNEIIQDLLNVVE